LLRFFLSASGLDAHPHLFNSESSRHDFSASCFPHLARQRFIPMAVLLDEAQAYKPAPACQPSAIALSKPFRNQ
jgi:hypothetical protein